MQLVLEPLKVVRVALMTQEMKLVTTWRMDNVYKTANQASTKALDTSVCLANHHAWSVILDLSSAHFVRKATHNLGLTHSLFSAMKSVLMEHSQIRRNANASLVNHHAIPVPLRRNA